ncbi:FAD/NAD(P)-binding domain-containing protein [Aspergillus japonicus CBS 114.51]|uniref:FAD/NAD(P)-binding domain-containing protein n=1 Tax=Aspergillus japonicus CBS 114.51 TaxID=1448312 RepID=A0A8T8WRC1_ASPJA|nr:FAD/NAD(P)-binding domain-containing protein [Aspergillus japonicus CBS 114.51]RAH78092.1 FAD/NAD(P)-binding domain-containing protein [Aspergillus japonicus CBS 114.51]
MPAKIVILGAGFAGLWSALAAQRLINLANQTGNIKVLVIAPSATLVLRPRLYEADAGNMIHPLGPLFAATGIEFCPGTAQSIDVKARMVHTQSTDGAEYDVPYDRLILATGSSVVQPPSITGLRQHAFDVDSLKSAAKLDAHLATLQSLDTSPARDTVVVCGAGFTGIELAAELPKRLGHIANLRVILVDQAEDLGPELGPGPRPVITQALSELGIESRLGSGIQAVDADGVTLMCGERIATKTAICTAGVRATPLTQQIPGPKDSLARVFVDEWLRAPSAKHILVTGDAACAMADREGHYALMSCQHALQLGRVAGHNAAADLLGESLVKYSQAAYLCCLDLGSWGAVISGGWERRVQMSGEMAKRVKCYINQKLIYPPEDAHDALRAANPTGPGSDELLQQILQVV